jgi:hypothetical protein
MLYSASTGGFYSKEIHGDAVPADAVEISALHHHNLLDAQARGATIAANDNGLPIAVFPPAPTLADKAAAAVRAVKAEAQRRITVVAPAWKQDNDNAALAQAALQLAIGGDHITVDVAPAIARREQIDAIRAASDALEEHVAALDEAGLAALDITSADHWPS